MPYYMVANNGSLLARLGQSACPYAHGLFPPYTFKISIILGRHNFGTCFEDIVDFI